MRKTITAGLAALVALALPTAALGRVPKLPTITCSSAKLEGPWIAHAASRGFWIRVIFRPDGTGRFSVWTRGQMTSHDITQWPNSLESHLPFDVSTRPIGDVANSWKLRVEEWCLRSDIRAVVSSTQQSQSITLQRERDFVLELQVLQDNLNRLRNEEMLLELKEKGHFN